MTSSKQLAKVIVIISTQIWTDNWVSKHWIAAFLAKQGYTVFFIEPIRGVAFRGGKIRDMLFGPRIRQVDGVNIVSISALPAFFRTSGILRYLFKLALLPQFKALNRLVKNNYYLITFDGRSLPFLKMLKKPICSAYYCVDPVGVGSEAGSGELQLAKTVDVNIAISERCANAMKKELILDSVSIVPHGIVIDQTSNPNSDSDVVSEFANIIKHHKRVIGYTGSIHDVYVNFDFVGRAASKLNDCHWFFVGPYKGSQIAENASQAINALIECSFTTFVGSKPAWKLADYIKKFDVCLIPYRAEIPNGWERRSPVKMLHYLQQGKPVVCADVPGISAYKHLIYTYTTFDQFLGALKTALAERSDDPIRKERMAFAKKREASVILEDLKKLIGV